MKQGHNRWRVLSALGGMLVGTAALASGLQLQEQSASGLGVAFSGMAAAAEDPSTVFWNPAGMSVRGGSGVSLSGDYVIPSFKFDPAATSTYAALGNGGDAGVSSVVPAVYGYLSLSPQFAVGLAINAPYGLSTEWSSPWAGMFYALKSKVDTLNINPAISWKVNSVLSLGAGVSYERLQATLTSAAPDPLSATFTTLGRIDASHWGWGWNVGALLDFGQGTRVGATYRSAIGYTLRGALGFAEPAFAPLESSIQAALRLPATASLGLSQQLTPQLRLLADYTWTGWSSIDTLNIIATSGPGAGQLAVPPTPLKFVNSWRAGAGLEYQLSAPWLLRAGAAYDRSPVQDAFRTPRLPDGDRTWLAAGLRFLPAP
ncbi:MAG TPA: outer membrane protein transport protein, partial [Steroidobacteraceae bacterium]|nr:outer membrane protein transport protein [Steroidobacteraceae bacterium]